MRTLLTLALAVVLAGCNHGSNAATTGNAAEPTSKSEPKEWTPLAQSDMGGKAEKFSHVIGFWIEAEHELRFVVSQEAVPENHVESMRKDSYWETEKPYMILRFLIKEGVKSLSSDSVESHGFGFYNLTKPSPTSIMNIGAESIKLLSGEAKVGAKVRVFIEYRSEEYKHSGKDKIHFDLRWEITLK